MKFQILLGSLLLIIPASNGVIRQCEFSDDFKCDRVVTRQIERFFKCERIGTGFVERCNGTTESIKCLKSDSKWTSSTTCEFEGSVFHCKQDFEGTASLRCEMDES